MANAEEVYRRSPGRGGSLHGSSDDDEIELTTNLGAENERASVLEQETLLHHHDDKDDEHHGDDDGLHHHEGIAPPGTASKPQVAMNIVISFVGAGMLGVPDAFRQAGWLLGSVALLGVSALNVYAMLLLPQVKRAIQKKQQKHTSCSSYGDLGRVILGPKGETLVNVCLGISQAGFATAYIIFISANLYSITKIPRAVTCTACVPVLACLVQFRDIKHLSPFSMLANFSNFLALSAVLLEDYKSFQQYDPEAYGEIQAVKWEGFLYVVAITIYSMEGIGLILSLEASCKDSSSFPWLLRLMLGLISVFMVFFGTAGYWAFGDITVAPITLNLVEHFWSATFVKCALCLGLYLTYPIMMFPIWSIAESMSSRIKEERTARIGFRFSVVVASCILAYLVPNFGVFLSLVGSSICTILAFILPGYFHLYVLKEDLASWQIGLDVFLIVGGVLFGMMGTYNSFLAMLHGELKGHG